MKGGSFAFFIPHLGCRHRCAFCDQGSITGWSAPTPAEVGDTLDRARESLGERMRTKGPMEIAFFGGSFTALPREQMIGYLEAASPFVGEGGFRGIRVSTRPDAVDADVLGILRGYGVTAVELGAQSMDDGVLLACGRGHTAVDVACGAAMVREAGFSLGLQMMTGLPSASGTAREGAGSARATLEALLVLRPDTLRIYPALTLRGTELAALHRAGRYRPQTLEEAVALCAALLERCREAGVPVIRLGLQDEASLRERLVAGPYHPAFRELCEGRALLRRAMRLLEGVSPGNVTLRVAVGSASRMAGHKRVNKTALSERGYRARVVEDPAVGYLEVALG